MDEWYQNPSFSEAKNGKTWLQTQAQYQLLEGAMDWLIVIPMRSIAAIFDNCFPRSHLASFPVDNEQSRLDSKQCMLWHVISCLKELCEYLYSIDVVTTDASKSSWYDNSQQVPRTSIACSRSSNGTKPIFTLNYPVSSSKIALFLTLENGPLILKYWVIRAMWTGAKDENHLSNFHFHAPG